MRRMCGEFSGILNTINMPMPIRNVIMTRQRAFCFAIPAVAALLAATLTHDQIAAQGRAQRKPNPKTNAATAKQLGRLSEFSDWVTSLAFSPDGSQLAAGTYGISWRSSIRATS